MQSYIKIALHDKRTGAFLANAVLLKTEDGQFRIYYRDGQFTSPDNNIAVPASRFDSAHGFTPIAEMRVIPAFSTRNPGYSFVTMMNDPLYLRDVEMRPCGDTVFQLDEGEDVAFDSLFAAQPAAQTSAGSEEVLVKTGYAQSITYTGFGGYHGHTQRNRFNAPLHNDKPYRMGVELELYAKSRADFDAITRARTNWFQCERDGSLTDSSLGIEIKTIPLKASDATSRAFWEAPIEKLKGMAKSWSSRTTGLHVHISKEILGADETTRQRNLDKLVWFYTYYVDDDPAARVKNNQICGREQGYGARSCKTAKGDWAKSIGLKEFAAGPYLEDAMKDVKDIVRRCRSDINIGNWDSYGTIEFRKGKGSVCSRRLTALCTWWEQMCLYCVRTHPRDFNFDDFCNGVTRICPDVASYLTVMEQDA